MLIRFGLHLDGLQPQAPLTAIGEVTLGPLGLLGVLETQLGLPGVIATAADVLMAYRACLAEADHPGRFYHTSFALDPINVSRTLLDWRATLYEHGWNGRFASDAPSRLRDLADVEAAAMSRVPLGRGQRVQRAAAALRELDTQIDRIELLDDVAELPIVWRALLDKLGFAIAPGVTPTPHARTGTDLYAVQEALAEHAKSSGGQPAAKLQLARDGTFGVLRGASRDITAQAVAECVIAARAPKPQDNATLVIAERDGVILDNAFERAGLPRAGFQHYSRFRALTQVLKLGLSLIWRPIGPQLLLQFLIHPVGPLPRHVRDDLADAVAEQPGIGGRKWRDALRTIETRMREKFGADEKAIAAVKSSIEDWVGGERFDPAAGAPIAALARRTQLCSTYLAIRMNGLDDDTDIGLYANALAQSEALLRALQSLNDQGQTIINRIELDRLIDEVASSAPDPNTFAQAHHVRGTSDPATVTQTWQRIYWWDLAPSPRDIGYPWSRKELAWLRANGVALFEVEDVLRIRTHQWLRPILNACEHLTLVVHDSERGYHPLWTQIDNLFDNFVEARVDDALLNGGSRDGKSSNGESLADIGMPSRPLSLQALPAPRRWWQLPKDVTIPRRALESYSSLSKLFDWPHGYVLRYCANLRAGRAQDLSDGNRLYGNLAHRLFERFFDDHPLWAMLDAQRVRAWLGAELPALIEAEAAVLLEPGRGVDRQRIGTTLARALTELLDHLRSAQIEAVQTEFAADAPFGSIRLGGHIDLLLTDLRGREIVLDVKWGSESYREKDLDANRHLQLAMYAYLRRTKQRWPQQAFFIIASGRVLAQDAGVFPNAVAHPAKNGESVEDLWRRIEASYAWRWQQLDAGRIEVNVAATVSTDASMPPLTALSAANDPDNFDDFVNLTGWADYQ